MTTPASPTSGFTGVAGTTYTLRWSIAQAPCATSTDDVIITLRANPTASGAGPDQSICGTSATLAGNTPSIGTGAWSIVSGAGGSIVTPASPNSTFTGVQGTTYTLRWTISNAPCTASTDDVLITFTANPSAANAGPDQNLCGTSCHTCRQHAGHWQRILGDRQWRWWHGHHAWQPDIDLHGRTRHDLYPALDDCECTLRGLDRRCLDHIARQPDHIQCRA